MLLELISRYYRLLWFALAGIAFIKIILSYAFHGHIRGLYGILYSVFNLYNEDEKEHEENASRKNLMRFMNLVTLTIYGFIILIILASLLLMVLGR